MSAEQDRPQLRPLGIGEVLDRAMNVYTRNAWTLLKIVAVVVVPLQILTFLVEVSTIDDPAQQYDFSADSQQTVDGAEVVGTLLITLLGFIVFGLATAACYRAIVDAYFGQTPDPRRSLRFAGSRFHSVLWVTFLSTFLGTLALLALIVPGIWLFFAWAVAIPVLLSEGTKGRKALGRSFRLVRGRWWPTAGALIVAFLLVGFLQGILSAAFIAVILVGDQDSVVLAALLSTLGSGLATLVTTPFQAAIAAVIYFDLRVRKEGLDLFLLAEQVGMTEGVDPETALAPRPLPRPPAPPPPAGAPEPPPPPPSGT